MAEPGVLHRPDVLPALLGWLRGGDSCVLATVVATSSSTPRPPGSAMVVGPDGSTVGSVSGGCVESDVHAVAEQVIVEGGPCLRTYGVADGEPGEVAVGLSCGGTVEVFVERVDPSWLPGLERLADEVEAGRPAAVATVVLDPDDALLGRRLVVGLDADAYPAGEPGWATGLRVRAREELAAGRSGLVDLGSGREVFVASYVPRPRMLVFGSTEVAACVAALGSFVGFRVTVCDAKAAFATTARFPGAAEVVVDRPDRYLRRLAADGDVDERTVLCVLGHDAKLDLPLLETAAGLSPFAYVGVLGSRRSWARLLGGLRAAGVPESWLRSVRAPTGLDVGASTPEETAVSVLAEVLAVRHGRAGRPLRTVDGPIHGSTRRPGVDTGVSSTECRATAVGTRA